jgi:hypothetical protein
VSDKHPLAEMGSEMDVDLARRVLREIAHRAELREPQYIKDCFDLQRRFLDSPCRFKCAICGRRSGKTEMVKRGLAWRMGMFPETVHVYIGVTRESAKRLLWQPLRRFARQYKLPLTFNKVELTVYHQNGSELWILGADKEEDMEKLRGPAYKTVAIDEAASYRSHLEQLVFDVIEPALGDHRGHLWLTGTPGRACAGLFYNASTHAPGYEDFRVFNWNVTQNPFFEDPVGWLADTRKRRGFSENHPGYRREYLGEWVKDESALVYRFDAERNLVDELPELPEGERYHRVLAIDFGVVDPTAFVVLAYSDHNPTVYIEEAYERADMSPSDAAEHVRLLQSRYTPPKGFAEDAFETLIGDTGGMGKAFAKEFEQRHNLFIRPAEKREKLAYIDNMNGDLLSGRLRLVKEGTAPLRKQLEQLVWMTLKNGKNRDKYDERLQDDHCTDAALYGWRECRGYRAEDRVHQPEKGSEEWWQRFERELEEAECREEEERRGGAWWERIA